MKVFPTGRRERHFLFFVFLKQKQTSVLMWLCAIESIVYCSFTITLIRRFFVPYFLCRLFFKNLVENVINMLIDKSGRQQ